MGCWAGAFTNEPCDCRDCRECRNDRIITTITTTTTTKTKTIIKPKPIASFKSKYKPITNKYVRIYLDVPYSEKDEVKELGARFDFDNKKWYSIPFFINNHEELVERWG